MDALITLLTFAFVMLLAAALPYVFVESRWRWRWREIVVGRLPADGAGGGLYRAGGDVPRYLQEAPRLIRWTAFSCFLLGQMFIPGLVVGLFGLMVAGVGLLSIPGLITAAKIYRVGFALLRREPRRAFFRAREAAAWALWLNGIIMAGSLLFVPRALGHPGTGGLIAFVDGYGLLSMAQALLMLHAVRVWEDALFTDSTAT